RGLDVRLAVRDRPLLALAARGRRGTPLRRRGGALRGSGLGLALGLLGLFRLLGLRLCHYVFAVAFFLPATVFRGPLRVRELVRVRWPRTGRLRRWRSPR